MHLQCIFSDELNMNLGRKDQTIYLHGIHFVDAGDHFFIRYDWILFKNAQYRYSVESFGEKFCHFCTLRPEYRGTFGVLFSIPFDTTS